MSVSPSSGGLPLRSRAAGKGKLVAAEAEVARELPCLEVLLGLPARSIARRSEGHLNQSLEVGRPGLGARGSTGPKGMRSRAGAREGMESVQQNVWGWWLTAGSAFRRGLISLLRSGRLQLLPQPGISPCAAALIAAAAI